MKYTNALGLPERFCNAVINDPYDKGDCDFSVTELLKPPRVRQLYLRHHEELTEDIAQNVFKLLGKGVHRVLEEAAGEGEAEKRLFMKLGDYTISGSMDLVVEKKTIYDWKVTRAYKVQKGDTPDWLWQLNGYRLIYFANGIEVDHLAVVAVIRDWTLRDAIKSQSYPKNEVQLLHIPILGFDTVREFFMERIYMHKAAEKELPECTPEDTWGGRRCEKYCSASKFCDQFKEKKNAK